MRCTTAEVVLIVDHPLESVRAAVLMGTTHSLIVNQQPCSVTIDHYETPLLYVLRNDLGLKGTRFGCGSGDCGACTVLVDGHAQRSCELPVWSVRSEEHTSELQSPVH